MASILGVGLVLADGAGVVHIRNQALRSGGCRCLPVGSREFLACEFDAAFMVQQGWCTLAACSFMASCGSGFLPSVLGICASGGFDCSSIGFLVVLIVFR